MNDDRPPSLTRTAWLVVLLLVPVALLNYRDRQMLAAMKSSMMHDIPDIATKANWGFVLGSFKWVYAAFSPIGGYVADRGGGPDRKGTGCRAPGDVGPARYAVAAPGRRGGGDLPLDRRAAA